jgi:hypothetical protein
MHPLNVSPTPKILARHSMAIALLALALNGCKSKEEAALAKAKQQAASTGQAQTITSTDKSGNTVTTTVQPPAPGQKDEVVTTTVTPKTAAATSTASASYGAPSAEMTQANPATTQANPPAPTPAPAPQIHVTAGTALAIRIDQRLSAKESQPGEKFTGEVVAALKGPNGDVIIPKGAPVTGKVDEAHKQGNFKGAATLELRLTSLTLDGKKYPLETRDVLEREKGKGKRTAGFIGGGAGLGMLLGGLAGGGRGVAIGGLAGAGAGTAGAGLTGTHDLVIPAESIVHFKLKDDLVIEP